MCFSAEISFGAAAVLGAAGVASVKKVNKPGQLMFAAIPLLFAVQQASEGMLWLSLSHAALVKWQSLFTYLFLFFAQMLWTTWLPLAFLFLEQERRRRGLLVVTLAAGLGVSILLGYRLAFYPVQARIDCSHILYDIGSTPFLSILSSLLYVVAIILPPFISGLRHMRLLGVLLAGSLLLSKLAYEDYLLSVWCFFAALLSIFIVYIMRQFHYEPSHKTVKDLKHQH